MTSKYPIPSNGKSKYRISICFFSYLIFCSQITFAIQASPPEFHQIHGEAGKYLGFNMEDIYDAVCRQGPPNYPKVTSLPPGMYSSGCGIYGYPLYTGTTRIEFPVEGGVWAADIVVSGESVVLPSSDEVHQINGVIGKYLGFDMVNANTETCRQGPPNYPKVTGLPSGMFSSGCGIYGYPENSGTTRIEFPIEGGIWTADIVIVDESTNLNPTPVIVHQIQGIVSQYLGFNMVDVNNETCRQGLPDYPKVEGLPSGMYSSGCSIYGYPENTGTVRIEFPVEGGIWLADIVVADTNSPDPVDPNPIDPNPVTPLIPIDSVSSEAARFLTQATFGTTTEDISYLISLNNYEDWIDEQFNTLPSLLLPGTHAIYQAFYQHCIQQVPVRSCPASLSAIMTLGAAGYVDTEIRQSRFVWWANVIEGEDQLRQRVAFALSEILVVSDISTPLRRSQFGVADYYDTLLRHSFGNYRDLLEDVSLHPVMGMYLGHVQNEKADPVNNIRPDENYARELMQLFSIGVHQLNLDGSLKKDAENKAIPTYGQAEVQEFAKVFTGWNFANRAWRQGYGGADRTLPMQANETYHDTSEKTLLNGVVLPAGQTTQQDLEAALDNIFNHPNVGPFIGKQLIQRLVNSNPTPEYVARVATIFNDNGLGERGDMKAVIKAILMDSEARLGHNLIADFGKMREPLLRLSHIWRTFNATKSDNSYFDWQVPAGFSVYGTLGLNDIAQKVLRSPSVFNFFLPSYSPAGVLREAGLVAPEFQLATENVIIATTNLINNQILTPQPANPRYTYLNLANETAIAADLDTLMSHLNLLLLSGSMTNELHTIIRSHLNDVNFPDGMAGRDAKVRDAIMLIVNSPEYLIQK